MPCKFPLIYHPCIRSYSFSSLSKFWDFKWGHYPTEIKGSGTQVVCLTPLLSSPQFDGLIITPAELITTTVIIDHG